MLRNIIERIRVARFVTLHQRSRRVIERWQTRALQRLLAHAAWNVPSYVRLFEQHRFEPRAFRDVSDVARLPIVTKDLFLKKPPEEFTDNSRLITGAWKQTSGTSGKPFSFLRESSMLGDRDVDFECLRFLLWQGYTLNQVATLKTAQIIVRSGWKKNYLLITTEEMRSDPQTAIRSIAESGPDILTSCPSMLLEVARHMQHRAAERIRPRYVVSFGETLSPLVRDFLSEMFGCEVYDRYGMGEVGAIGTECARHNGFHLHAESVFVEVVDERDKSLPPGQFGRVIVTDLQNYSMPFIRYETGDRGALLEEPCECGLRVARIVVQGREMASVMLGGRKVPHVELTMALDDFKNAIYQFQIVKKTDTTIGVRVVRGPAFIDRTGQEIITQIKNIVGDATHIVVETVSSLPLTQSGKLCIVVDESIGGSALHAPTGHIKRRDA